MTRHERRIRQAKEREHRLCEACRTSGLSRAVCLYPASTLVVDLSRGIVLNVCHYHARYVNQGKTLYPSYRKTAP